MTPKVFERGNNRILRGYGDERKKLRRTNSRRMRSRTKEIKKKRDRVKKGKMGEKKGIKK